MRKLLPMFMLAFTLIVSAFAPVKQPQGPPGKMLTSSLSKDPLKSREARAAKRALIREERREARRAAIRREHVQIASASPQLEAIAACESDGDPTAVSSSGAYRGKYQFSPATWQAVGGQGDPAAAPEAEQDRRAAILMQRSGPGQWPVCGS